MHRPRILVLCAFAAVVALDQGGCSIAMRHSNGGIGVFEKAPGPVGPVAVVGKYVGWVAAAPVVVAMAPLVVLAWATPWVDLSDVEDALSVPALGLGYATEAIAAAPLYAAFFWLDDARADASAGEVERGPVPWGFVTRHEEPSPAPRPAEPLPATVAATYAVPPGAAERLGAALDAAIARGDPGARAAVRLDPPFLATLEWTPAAGDPGAHRVVLMTPPSQGVFAARWLAARYARRGVHAAVVVPDEEAFLDPALDAAGIERKLRAAVIGARTVAQMLARRPDVAPVAGGHVLYLGISAGGIFGSVLLAVEPAIARAALIFPGGDLGTIAATSTESTVRAYRDAWAARGLDAEALAASFEREVRTDPLRLARHVDPARALLFLSAGDTLVPIAGGRALREAMGGPETWELAGDHQTSGICFSYVLRRVDEFLLSEKD